MYSVLLAATLAAGAPAGLPPQADKDIAVASRGGTLWLRPNLSLLDTLGVSAAEPMPRDLWSIPLLPGEPLQVELGDGAATRVIAGDLVAPELRLQRADGTLSASLRLVPDGAVRHGWRLVDAKGATWLRITHGMRSPERADGVRLVTADLRVGPALAAWTGVDADGLLFANAALQVPLDAPAPPRPKSCTAPNWPGTAGYVADVELVDMIDVGGVGGIDVMRCRTGEVNGCDGPGGDDGEVVYVPSAMLRNRSQADAADLPWHQKFTGSFPPYGNDQHPFLVWSFYRIDADGALLQFARSGLKHAFASANDGCIDNTCPRPGQVIGRGCSDIYNAGSNDWAFQLSPREELNPARGIWARCGSIFDDLDNNPGDGLPGCDGVQDAPVNDDGYRYRMVARETDIDAALHPGAEWLIDAWYIVRDDADLFNTMGSRTLQPQFVGGLWRRGTMGAFVPGAVIDAWLARASAQERAWRTLLESAEGRIGVAVRVRQLPDQRYRYDYALMNFDFARVAVDPGTAEPNLRFLGNIGVSSVAFDLNNGAAADSQELRDGDAQPGNDWNFVPAADMLRWNGPAMLRWGQLVFVRVVSPAAPGLGRLHLGLSGGSPAEYTVQTLVPDAAALFFDGFE